VKAGIFALKELCPLGTKDWDYEDQRRVQVNRGGVTRVRPAMRSGWKISTQFQINLPEYLKPDFVHALLNDAGRLVGIGDFRPTFGRFLVKSFSVE
jgi:hypothetical protein